MTINTIDWDKLTTQGNTTRVLLETLNANKIDTLNRVHAAICKWHDIADQDIETFRLEANGKWNDAWDEYGYDPVGDEEFMLAKSEQALWGSFAVSIVATIEDVLTEICTAKALALTN